MTTQQTQQNTDKKIPKLRFGGFEGEWEERKLGEVGDVIGGGTPDTTKQEFWDNGEINWFTPSEIKNKYISESDRKITRLGLEKSSAKLLPAGTLLLSSRATVGEISIAKKESSTNQGFQSIVINKENSNEFVYYWIKKNKKEFLKRAHGSTFLEVPSREVKKIKITIPAKVEQEKIASFLSVVDEWVENLKGQKEDLEKYKKGVMQKLFPAKGEQVPQLRFSGFAGNWEEKKLGEVMKSIPIKKFQIKNSEFLESGKFKVIDQGNNKIAGYSNASEKVLKNKTGFVVFGDHTTILKYIDFDFIVGADGVKVLKEKDNLIATKYLFYSIQFNNVEQEGYKRHFSILKEKKIFIPPLPEQEKIASFLTALDDIIEKTEQKISQAEQWKKGLMQRLFV